MLRGGAPFLSPSCALQLVEWFDEGVGVPAILLALERAAEARRRNRSRVPLNLRQARRHLGKQGQVTVRRGQTRSLAPLIARFLTPEDQALTALYAELTDIDPTEPELAMAQAMMSIRTFLTDRWHGLHADDRSRRLRTAEDEMEDLLVGVPEGDRQALLEEVARDSLRQGYEELSAANVWELISP